MSEKPLNFQGWVWLHRIDANTADEISERSTDADQILHAANGLALSEALSRLQGHAESLEEHRALAQGELENKFDNHPATR